jgi:hypothetical protein
MKFLFALLSFMLVCGSYAAPAKPAAKAPVKKAAAKKRAPRRNVVKTYYDAKFVKGGWKMSDWEMVRSWRFDHDAQFIQLANCIQNKVPEGVSDIDLQGKKGTEGYAIMLLKQKFTGNTVITCNMEFDYRMAPGIILAYEPVKYGKDKLELREHFEVILYDDGLNLWHHYFEKGQPGSKDPRVIKTGVEQKWRKQCYTLEKKFYKPKTKYEVKVNVRYTGRGPQIEISCGGRTVGCYAPQMPKGAYRIGLVGCEGRNRFYDFKVTNR